MKFRQHQHGIGRVLFTSDQHFGHFSVIAMCGRDFKTADEMDHYMIEAWNSVVGDRDVVWFLGDFALDIPPERTKKIFHQLRGQKHLIIGNHDRKHVLELPWTSKRDMAHITVDGQRIHLLHYGLRVWPGMWRKAIHLYGHSHGRLPGNRMSLDVGVDSVGYFPVDLDEIQKRLLKLPEIEFPEELAEGEDFDAGSSPTI